MCEIKAFVAIYQQAYAAFLKVDIEDEQKEATNTHHKILCFNVEAERLVIFHMHTMYIDQLKGFVKCKRHKCTGGQRQ